MGRCGFPAEAHRPKDSPSHRAGGEHRRASPLRGGGREVLRGAGGGGGRGEGGVGGRGGGVGVALRNALRAFLLVAVGAIVLSSPPRAEAGSYTVHVCDAASGNRTDAISFSSSGTNAAYSSCPTDSTGHRIGFVARSGMNGGT